MSDSTYSTRITYLTADDIARLPGSMPSGLSCQKCFFFWWYKIITDVESCLYDECLLMMGVMHLKSCCPPKGFLPRRPKERKYQTMILNLADAVEPSPFFLTTAASYLRDWVTESAILVPPLDVSILTTSSRPALQVQPVGNTVPVAALEPGVSNVRIERGNPGGPQELVANPRMDVICGIAKTLQKEGVTWTDAINKGYELWDKLNPNVMAALNQNSFQGIVAAGAAAESTSSPDPPVVEDLEDDASVPLQPEFDDVDR